MDEDWTPPENYWIVSMKGDDGYFSDEIMREVVLPWLERDSSFIHTIDLFGDSVILARGHIEAIFEHTARGRSRVRKLNQMLKAENDEGKPPWEMEPL